MMSLERVIVDTLRAEVKPAMGCTEPVAVALAVAKAKEMCQAGSTRETDGMMLEIKVSPNIFKNGLSVGIPGTDQVGLIVASALGLLTCYSDDGLEVFKHVKQSDIEGAFKVIDEDRIKLGILDTDKKVLIDARVVCGDAFGRAVIQDRHDQFVFVESHAGVVFEAEAVCAEDEAVNPIYETPLSEVIRVVESLPFEDLAFLLDGFEMNRAVAEYGLANDSGMNVGRTLEENTRKGILSRDLMNRAMILTAAASDARMSGVSLPVMSSNGSGNNGLTALLPIVAYAETNPTSPDRLARAAAISHLVNSVIKYNIGRLSALCGCGVAAGTGASVAITWLMGGSVIQMEGAIQNMIANTTGMICDGAKVGCSLKLATSASAAIQSSLLAIGNVVVPSGNGVIGKTADETIKNLGYLSKNAMDVVDRVILNVMMGARTSVK
jgi:L-cysteine desulfidase